MSRAEDKRLEIYRKHNVTRVVGRQTDGTIAGGREGEEMAHGSGMTGKAPVPCEDRCKCEDCRRVGRSYSRTVAAEGGER